MRRDSKAKLNQLALFCLFASRCFRLYLTRLNSVSFFLSMRFVRKLYVTGVCVDALTEKNPHFIPSTA
jgi:hypothetical protein